MASGESPVLEPADESGHPQRSSTLRRAEEAPATYDASEFVRREELALQSVVCQGCQRVPREPRMTQCCRQTYCLPCLTAERGVGEGEGVTRSLKRGCRHCGEQDNFWHSVNLSRQRVVESLQVRCQNEGCEWSGTLRERQEEHSSTCERATVTCTKLCMARVSRKDLAQHLEEDCRYRDYRCKHCNYEGVYAEIMGLDPTLPRHRCPMLPVSCPNKCRGSKMFLKRAELPAHLRSCPLEKLDCQFKSVGCDTKVVRKLYESHMRNAQQQHLSLMLSSFLMKTKGLRDEISLLMQSVQDPATLSSLACMKSHMQLEKLVLSGVGDEVTFRITNFSQLERCSDEEGEWHSPSFYFLTGYKMELVVHPGGSGKGMGVCVSVDLLLHKPEEGNRLDWPLDCVGRGVRISLVKQSDTPTASAGGDSQKSSFVNICSLCSQDKLAVPDGEDPPTLEMMADNEFFPLENLVDSGLLLHDSVVVRVEMIYCECVTTES